MATFHENLVQSFTNFKNKYITPIQTALNDKQDKLINPLTQSDVKDNLTSTSTTTPLSANQGKVLNTTLSKKLTVDTWWPAHNTTTPSNTYDGVYSTAPDNIPSDLLSHINTYDTDISTYGTISVVKTVSYLTAIYVDVYGNVLVRFTNTGYSNGKVWNRITMQEILPMFSIGGKKCKVTQVITGYYSHYVPFSDISTGDIIFWKFNNGSIFVGVVGSNSDWQIYRPLLNLGVSQGSDVPNTPVGKVSPAKLTNGLRIMESRSEEAVAWYCVLGKTLANDVSGMYSIKTKNVSGTTSIFGMTDLHLGEKAVVLNVKLDSPLANCTFILAPWNGAVHHKLVDVATTNFEAKASQAYSGTITYLQLNS